MFNNNQNKPPGFNLSQPQQEQNEWNINNCPWAPSNNQEGTSSAVMQFVGVPVLPTNSSPNVQPQQPQPGPSWSGNIRDRPARLPRTKRRSESEDPIPAKQYLSEEKMIARLSTLRLSEASIDDINLEESDDEADMQQPFPVNLTPQELEQRLKNASRITVMKSVQKSLKQNPEMPLPPSILERMEQQPRPSMAVVLWQPPLRFPGQPTASYDQPTSSSEEEDDPNYYMDANNNNNDPNNNNEVEDMDL